MPELYSLTGCYRQNGKMEQLSGEVVVFPQTGRITGPVCDDGSPEQKRTLEGTVKREGLQAELDFHVNVPGDKLLNIRYRVRGSPEVDSFAGVYYGAWKPVAKEIGPRITCSFETCRTQETAYTCKTTMLAPRKSDMGGEYAQITLTKKSEKKITKKKKRK